MIFILLDQFTKFPLAKALPMATSAHVIKYLTEVFSIFGVPESLLSDNGSQFKLKDFQKFLKDLGINHVKTGLYALQSNASERVNRTILAGIRAYVEDNHDKWDAHFPEIMASIRSSFHSAIKTNPYNAMFGQNMVIHGSMYRLLKKLGALSGEDIGTEYSEGKFVL